MRNHLNLDLFFKKPVLVGVTLLLAGCAIGCCRVPCAKGNGTLQEIQNQLAQGLMSNQCIETPDCVKTALLPLLKLNSTTILATSDKKFDVIADQVPARMFFSNLVEGTPYNILLGPSVSGEISVNLKKVRIQDVLSSVRDLYGYEYRFTKSGIEVTQAALETRAFKVNYLNINRGGSSDMRVMSGSLGGTSGASENTSGVTNASADATSNINSRITTTLTTNFWEELKTSLELMIGPGEIKKVAISPLAGLVVVQAYPHELRRVQDFLKSAEQNLNRQVILEAKILEVELSDGFSSGINWSLISGGLRVSQLGSGVLDSGVNVPGLPGGIPYPNSPTLNLNPGSGLGDLGTLGTQSSVFGGVLSLGMNFRKMASFIELLQSQGKVQVLSSPRISTTNNQKALIKVGNDAFFITNIQASDVVTSGGVAVSNNLPDITFESFFSGIALDVTPQINENNTVTLHVHPTISDVTEEIKTVTIQDVATRYPLANSQIRESDTIVQAQNGQVIVLGGLMQDKKSTLVSGIPCLKSIPGLGRLFRHERVKNVKSELVILIRPLVVDNEVWSDHIQDSLNRMDQMQSQEAADNSVRCRRSHRTEGDLISDI